MVVSDVGDVDGKLVIDGVDVHAMMFLIASMFYKPFAGGRLDLIVGQRASDQ